MNLSKLFDMQRALDKRIVKDKGLEGQDLPPQKLLALQVELGECANEWRGFKYWSVDQQPRTFKGHKEMGNRIVEINPLLEEYIDCLHFVLSVGNQIGYDIEEAEYLHEDNVKIYAVATEIREKFSEVFGAIHVFSQGDLDRGNYELYEDVALHFLALGSLLGFTWDQIEEAYKAKNAVNHQRQDTGY
ncbi:dUTP diphosphatase [Paenibacillus polymyxa]|uniref:dUTP diphosphatase n=1 Tax=Paenibacillus polymyxa TaxID=1406 RepID=UPI00307F97F6